MGSPSLSTRIRVWRSAAGLSQKQLAERVQVTTNAVSQWETDRARPLHGNLERIIEACGVSPRIFWGDLPGA